MNDKASAAGWVIEVRRPVPGRLPSDLQENAYYNVASSDFGKATSVAVEVAKKAGFVGEGRHVRSLSQGELETLNLAAGEARAA